MMDTQRLVLWVIFSMSILFLWDSWQKHNGKPSLLFSNPSTSAAKLANGNAVPVSNQPGQTLVGNTNTVTPGAVGVTTTPNTAAPVIRGEVLTLSNDVLKLNINTLGAVLERAELLKHKSTQDPTKTLVLLDNSAGKVYVAETGLFGVEGAPNHLSLFNATQNNAQLAAGQQTVSLTLTAETANLRVSKIFTLKRGSYAIDLKTIVENISTQSVSPMLYMHLKRHGESASQASFFAGPAVFTGPAVYTDSEKFQKISFSDIDKDKAKFTKTADNGWVALVQHYFVSAWVPAAKVAREYYAEKAAVPGEYRVGIKTPLGSIAPGAKSENDSLLWVGPQDQNALAEIAPGLDLVVDYGFLTLLAKPMFHLLTWLHALTGNWGWAIVLLTVIIKAIFYFPMASSYKSMANVRTPDMRNDLDKIIKGGPINKIVNEYKESSSRNIANDCFKIDAVRTTPKGEIII